MFCSFSKAVPPNNQSGQSPLLSPLPGPDGPGVLRVEQDDGDQLRFFVGEVEHLCCRKACWSDSNHVETRWNHFKAIPRWLKMAQAILNILKSPGRSPWGYNPSMPAQSCGSAFRSPNFAAKQLLGTEASFVHTCFFLPCAKEGRDNLSILDSISIPLVWSRMRMKTPRSAKWCRRPSTCNPLSKWICCKSCKAGNKAELN